MLTVCRTFELTSRLRNQSLTLHARGDGFYIMFITIFFKFSLNTPCTITFFFIIKKVKAYVEGHKTDANDALAIANTALQIGIKYSKPKSMEQQTLMSLEANGQFLSKTIVSLGLHIRSIINEYGIVKAKGTKGLAALVTSTLDEGDVLPASLINLRSV
ncbi:hypothetical protein VAE122_1830002 [Vibrio aestuarianus]|nr:hypothetical protein VAE122_1830002 [Vibrio aestuarianus]